MLKFILKKYFGLCNRFSKTNLMKQVTRCNGQQHSKRLYLSLPIGKPQTYFDDVVNQLNKLVIRKAHKNVVAPNQIAAHQQYLNKQMDDVLAHKSFGMFDIVLAAGGLGLTAFLLSIHSPIGLVSGMVLGLAFVFDGYQHLLRRANSKQILPSVELSHRLAVRLDQLNVCPKTQAVAKEVAQLISTHSFNQQFTKQLYSQVSHLADLTVLQQQQEQAQDKCNQLVEQLLGPSLNCSSERRSTQHTETAKQTDPEQSEKIPFVHTDLDYDPFVNLWALNQPQRRDQWPMQ